MFELRNQGKEYELFDKIERYLKIVRAHCLPKEPVPPVIKIDFPSNIELLSRLVRVPKNDDCERYLDLDRIERER